MIVNIAMPFEATVIRKGGRNGRKEWFIENVPVSIDEVDEADAPVAFRIHERFGQAELRWRDGKVWWPLMLPEGRTAERWAGIVGARSAPGAGLGLAEAVAAAEADWPAESIIEAAPREIITNGRDEAVVRLQRKALEVMVCGGRIYLAGAAPVLRVVLLSNSLRPHRGSEITVTWTDNYPPNVSREHAEVLGEAAESGQLFRIDQASDAASFAGDWSKRNERSALGDIPAVDILIPEAIRSDVLTRYVRYHAEVALSLRYERWEKGTEAQALAVFADLEQVLADREATAGDLVPALLALVAFADNAKTKKLYRIDDVRKTLARVAVEAGRGYPEALPGRRMAPVDDEAITRFAL